jgi:4-amino-4-deoxy-L-arabinose transferase-like glycosyltransferase
MAQTRAEIRLSPAAWVLLGLGALALVLVHAQVTVFGPDAERFTFDSAEYALAGRAWLETGRLVTPYAHPSVLASIPGPPFPLIAGHPLVPALDALAFALLGQRPEATLAPAILAYVACVLLVARLALGLSGSRTAAIGAAAGFAVAVWPLTYALDGRSEMPFAALLTAAFVLLWELPDASRPLWLGATLGLAQLARPVTLPLLPALGLGLWFLAPRASRVRCTLLALAGFLPLASLTALYKWATVGSPFVDVGGYLLLAGTSPEYAVSRLNRMTPPPDALAWVRAHPGAFADKIAHDLGVVLYGAWVAAGRFTGSLAGISSGVAFVTGDRRLRVFVATLAGTLVLLTLLSSATVPDRRMLFPLLPPGVALSFAVIARMARRLDRRGVPAVALAAALAVGIGAVPLVRRWLAVRSADPASRPLTATEWRGLERQVAALLPPDSLVASDAAPWIAWGTHRPATLVPLEPSDLLSGGARLRPAAVVLTNEWLVWQPLETAWRALLEREEAPAGYRFAGHVRSGRMQAVVFTRVASP